VRIVYMSARNSGARAFGNFIKSGVEVSQYDRYSAEEHEPLIMDGLRMIEAMFPEKALVLCNRSHPKLKYAGENVVHVLGVTSKEFTSMAVIDFFQIVHPDDLDPLKRCFEYLSALEPYDPIEHRFVLYYRIKHPSGKYIHLKDEKLAIQNAMGNYVYAALYEDVSASDRFINVRLDLFQRQASGKYAKSSTFSPVEEDSMLTPRQQAIVKLIFKGYSNQEIADALKVSVNTVRNHKQSLFRKTKVRSSGELIRNFAGEDKFLSH
jgi:DNA-binding CsgD family transcriptional regulator